MIEEHSHCKSCGCVIYTKSPTYDNDGYCNECLIERGKETLSNND